MVTLHTVAIWLVQAVLFLIGIVTLGLAAHVGSPLIADAFNADELIPSAIIFFAVAAALGWIGNRFWPEEWIHNPLL